MAYCGPRGIPLTTFLSWAQSDQDAALEWQAHENRRCTGCGTHPDDWDPGRDGSRTYGHWHETICPGCQLKQRAAKGLEQDGTRGVHLAFARGPAGTCRACSSH